MVNPIRALQEIKNIKTDIYNAIKDKNVDIPANTLFKDYPDMIESIVGGGGTEDTDFSAMLVLEGIVTGTEQSKAQIENETAAILSTI